LDLSKAALPCITQEMAFRFTKIKDGDLIISDASEDYEGVGKVIEISNVSDKEVIAGLHTLHLRLKNDDYINGFKGYIFNHPRVRNLLLRSATGIKVYSVSKSGLKKILLPIPTKQEQTDIVIKLDKLRTIILNKDIKLSTLQRLKKSLMQNLLTGKVRVDLDKIEKLLNNQ
jgi:type I restriction enzyme S subunit